jgi:hypothetical protein
LPFLRDAAAFALDLDEPPSFPSMAAISLTCLFDGMVLMLAKRLGYCKNYFNLLSWQIPTNMRVPGDPGKQIETGEGSKGPRPPIPRHDLPFE